jgi:hypothetical protein
VIPIRIFNEPKLVQSDEPWRVPDGWNPMCDGYEPTYLYHEQNKVSDYYNRTWLANWRLWYKKAGVAPPVLIEANYKVAGQEEEEKKSDL